MKQWTKAFLVTALVCGVIGAAFCIVSLCIGFQPEEFRAKAEAGDFQIVGPPEWKERVEGAVSDFTAGQTDFTGTYSGIRTLEVDVGAADCILIPDTGTVWRVKGYRLPSSFRVRHSGTTLEVDCSARRWQFWNWGNSSRSARLEIYIPKGELIRELNLETGVGDVRMEDGYLQCRRLELDSGVGSSSLSLDILDSAEVQCGVGDVELNLLGAEPDFNYELEYGVGDVEIDGSSSSGLGEKETIDNHAPKNIRIECGVGSASINFFEEGEQ